MKGIGRIIAIVVAGFIVYTCARGLSEGYAAGSQPPARKDVHILSENSVHLFSDNHVASENHVASDNTSTSSGPSAGFLIVVGVILLGAVILSGGNRGGGSG